MRFRCETKIMSPRNGGLRSPEQVQQEQDPKKRTELFKNLRESSIREKTSASKDPVRLDGACLNAVHEM